MSLRPKAMLTLALGATWLFAGCGGDDGTPGDSTSKSGDTTNSGDAPEAEPFPPLPDPAPALACTATTVLCVDATAGASAPDGSADQPFASVNAALDVAEPGAVIQVADGVYEEQLEISGSDDLRLIGGFGGGDFSERDPPAFETVLRGGSEAAVVAIVESSNIHVEGFRMTSGGGHSAGDRVAGGGVFVDETASEVSIAANRIDGNAVDREPSPETGEGGGIASYGAGVAIVGNVIEDNRGGRGAGITGIGDLTIDRNVVRGNVGVGDHGGGLYLAGEVTLTGNRVEGNTIGTDYGWGGGIVVFNDESDASLRGNVVTGNHAPSAGSGVFIDDGADATLVGELYYGNECGGQGGQGLYVDSGGTTPTEVQVVNTTIARHDCPEAALGGNAILVETQAGDSAPVVTVTNSILWDNAGRDVFTVDATVDVTYTISEESIDGTGNLDADPMFVDADGGDFHLSTGSPAIDGGDPAADFSSEPDPNGGRIDMGHTGNSPEASSSP